jgi:hypothetical protein
MAAQAQDRSAQTRSRWDSLSASTKVLVIAAILGYLPQIVLSLPLPVHGDQLGGTSLAWGLWVTIPSTLVIIGVAFYRVVKFFVWVFDRDR